MLCKRTFRRRSLAFALATTLLCPPGGLLIAAHAQDVPPAAAPAALPPPPDTTTPGSGIRIPMSPVQPGPIKTILLFPFANAIPATGTSGGFSPDVVGARVEDAVKMRLNIIGRYKANSFSPSLPQIQRALQESRVEGLTENDLTPPYNDAQRGDKISTQIGTDGYLLGSIEALSVDPSSRNVTLTVSATLYNTETGGAVKSLAYTGRGISYNTTDDPDALLQSAINDVAGHVVSALNASAVKQRPASLEPHDYTRGSRSSSGSILLGILIAAGVGLAISSSHHGGGSTIISGGTGTGTGTGTGSGPPSPPTGTVTGGTPPNPPAAGG